ncbi:hypothetical protein V6Z11_A10G276700 [Gossypium hirsutum]
MLSEHCITRAMTSTSRQRHDQSRVQSRGISVFTIKAMTNDNHDQDPSSSRMEQTPHLKRKS